MRTLSLLSEAEQLLESDPRQAAILAEQAVAIGSGKDPQSLLMWCRALLKSGAWEEALGCFGMIDNPERLPSSDLARLGDEALALGVPVLAMLALDAVPESDPGYLQVGPRLMAIKFQQGRTADVLEMCRDLTRRAPDLAEPWFWLGQVWDQLSNPPEASRAYTAFLERGAAEPAERRTFAIRRLRRLLIDLGDFAAARGWDTVLATEDGSSTPEDEIDRAALLHVEGKHDESLAILDDLLKRSPNNVAALELRARIAVSNGADALAESDLRRLLKLEPLAKQAHYQLALLLNRSGRPDEAGPHFSENRRLTEISTRIISLQGESFSDVTREKARLSELAAAYEQLGQTRMAEKLKGAMNRLEQALPENPQK